MFHLLPFLGAASAANPNVLFVVADDLRPLLGVYNLSFMKTPHIDAMAAQGTVFNHAFVQQAVCGPSRTRWAIKSPERLQNYSAILSFSQLSHGKTA
jgi:hypothetical protein